MNKLIVRIFLCFAALLPALASAQKPLGDFIVGQTIRCPWATFDKSGNSATPGTAGTLYVYKDGATGTEKAIVGDLSGTDTRGIDGNAGDHETNFPTTDAFFAADADYVIRARGTVVDSQTINAPLCMFSLEHHFPLKGYILLHTSESTGSSSTVGKVYLQGSPITADNKYQYNRLWDPADGWSRAIVSSAMSDNSVTIYPDAPAAPTNGTTLYVTLDVIYPVNFFDPTASTVIVGAFGATAGGATAITNVAGSNIAAVFDNGGAGVSANARIGTIADNVTGVDLLGGGTTLAANIRDASGMLAYGLCSGGSTKSTCINASLTQADNFWSNWTMIVVQGQPPRCVRSFTASTDALGWPQDLPNTAASQKFILLAAPECRSPP